VVEKQALDKVGVVVGGKLGHHGGVGGGKGLDDGLVIVHGLGLGCFADGFPEEIDAGANALEVGIGDRGKGWCRLVALELILDQPFLHFALGGGGFYAMAGKN
jgi:hypothetical protein